MDISFSGRLGEAFYGPDTQAQSVASNHWISANLLDDSPHISNLHSPASSFSEASFGDPLVELRFLSGLDAPFSQHELVLQWNGRANDANSASEHRMEALRRRRDWLETAQPDQPLTLSGLQLTSQSENLPPNLSTLDTSNHYLEQLPERLPNKRENLDISANILTALPGHMKLLRVYSPLSTDKGLPPPIDAPSRSHHEIRSAINPLSAQFAGCNSFCPSGCALRLRHGKQQRAGRRRPACNLDFDIIISPGDQPRSAFPVPIGCELSSDGRCHARRAAQRQCPSMD